MADPIWKRTSGKEKGRDGCRVSIPWSEATAHKNFKGLSAEIQEDATESMLNYYRKAIAMRKELCVNEEIEFVDAPNGVIGFKRGANWSVFTNFNETPVALPSGKVLISSAPIANGEIPASATVWLSN